MTKATETLWDNFCRLRLQSRAYRAVDDPIVARAYNDWLACYLPESAAPKASSVIKFRKPGGAIMNAHVKPPLLVTDPHIRKQLQLAGLQFVCSRARWLEHEATKIGLALKSGAMSSDEADVCLEELGALDLVYPELMGRAE
jgi:hypothetical protein